MKEIRKEKNISQDRLFKSANVAYNTVIKIKLGTIQNPTIKTIKKITDALMVSVDNLIT